MVNVAMSVQYLVAASLYAAAASATVSINFINQCTHPIELYHSQSGSAASRESLIAVGGTYCSKIAGPAHMFRHGADVSATLLEISIADMVWIDISAIPPDSDQCGSYEECKANNSKTGFNVPMSVVPTINVGVDTCSALFCAADDKILCTDAYLYPMDNNKTHCCPIDTSFDVTFCYNNNNNNGDNVDQQDPIQQGPNIVQGVLKNPAQQGLNIVQGVLNPTQQGSKTTVQEGSNTVQEAVTPTQQGSNSLQQPLTPSGMATTPDKGHEGGSQSIEQEPAQPGTVQTYAELGELKSKYEYLGKYAGNVPGSFDAVVDLPECRKETVYINSPVGPLSEPVTMVLRGPMYINKMIVFSDETNKNSLERVSFYSHPEGKTENMVFMANLDVDYSGQNKHSPQCYVSSDGLSKANEPTVFGGKLSDASDPSKIGAGPGISTAAEINILTGKKCSRDSCLGFSGKNDHQGWGGNRRVFVVEASMPRGTTVDLPAIWILNARVVHTDQYGCNCRRMGHVGGCGEWDVAEVIETNIAHTNVSTHYYFFNGDIVSDGGDNFAPRRYDGLTTYVAIIDASGEGVLKILELSSFDFTLLNLDTIYQKLMDY